MLRLINRTIVSFVSHLGKIMFYNTTFLRNRHPERLSNRVQVKLQATTAIHTKEGDSAVEYADGEVKDVDHARSGPGVS